MVLLELVRLELVRLEPVLLRPVQLSGQTKASVVGRGMTGERRGLLRPEVVCVTAEAAVDPHIVVLLLLHGAVVGGLGEAEVVVGDLGEMGGRAIGRWARRVKGRRLYTLLKIRQSVLKLKIGRWCPKTLFCFPVYSSPP